MKYLHILTSFLFLTLSSVLFGQFDYDYEGHRIITSYYEFKEGSKEYLYGDDVVLREKPSSTAQALDTLSIGSEIAIVKKSDETMSLNGLDWNWYKVKVGRKTGYILGGLIAFDRIIHDDVVYLVTMAGVKNSPEDEYVDHRVRARVLQKNGEFYGHETRLNTNSFYIEATGNRGLDGLKSMLVINQFAEACGVDGGEIYLFNDGTRLFEGIQTSIVSEAGLFWYEERLVFPDEENNSGEGIVRYEREQGEYMDEEMTWSKAVINTLLLTWADGTFTPNIEEFDFGDEE